MILTACMFQPHDQYDDKWEVIRLAHAPMGEEEETERQDYLAEVADPDYLLKMRTDADAEGDMEDFFIDDR